MTSKNVITKFATALVAAVSLLTLPALSRQSENSQQQPAQNHDGMAGMDRSRMQHDSDKSPDAAKAANDGMSDHDMDMGAHMFMTDLRPASAADQKRAAEVLAELRPAIEKYKDYRVALADGFKIFLPNVPQKQYHFTNYAYAMEAAFEFNPAHPTSLLYRKTNDGYELVGAMYTARRNATEQDLNARVPLSVARWHKHVNFCFGAKGGGFQQVDQKGFGFRGDITTQDACEQAGGRWYPQIFNWMVHVYPYETDPAKIWAH